MIDAKIHDDELELTRKIVYAKLFFSGLEVDLDDMTMVLAQIIVRGCLRGNKDLINEICSKCLERDECTRSDCSDVAEASVAEEVHRQMETEVLLTENGGVH